MQVKVNRRSAYAPIRYEATRPFAVSLGKAFAAAAARGEAARRSFIMDTLAPVLQKQLSTGPQGGGPVQGEIGNVQVFGGYMDGGKIILDMSKVLSQALLHTDAANVPCGELVFPFENFYIHFGGDVGLHDSGMTIEGVFVHKATDRVIFELTPGGFGSEHYLSLPAGESMVGGHILLDDPEKTISKALHDSIDEIVAGNKAFFERIAQFGACQGSCRLIYAAKGCLRSAFMWSATTESRSGLRVTAPIGDQSRVVPDQRAGLRSRALRYSSCRAARMA